MSVAFACDRRRMLNKWDGSVRLWVGYASNCHRNATSRNGQNTKRASLDPNCCGVSANEMGKGQAWVMGFLFWKQVVGLSD